MEYKAELNQENKTYSYNFKTWGEHNDIDETDIYNNLKFINTILHRAEQDCDNILIQSPTQSGKTNMQIGLMNGFMDQAYPVTILLTGSAAGKQVAGQSTDRAYKYFKYTEHLHFGERGMKCVDGAWCSIADSVDKGRNVCLVAKKHVSDLDNLRYRLNDPAFNGRNCIIIDDECDFASVSRQYPSKVSESLHLLTSSIKSQFDKVKTISMSATPAANLLQDKSKIGADQFDYIDVMPLSDHYFGNKEVFQKKELNHWVKLEWSVGDEDTRIFVKKYLVGVALMELNGVCDGGDGFNGLINTHNEIWWMDDIADEVRLIIEEVTLCHHDDELLKTIKQYQDSVFQAYGVVKIEPEKVLDKIKNSEVNIITEHSKKWGTKFKNRPSGNTIVISGLIASRGMTYDGLFMTHTSLSWSTKHDTAEQKARWSGFRGAMRPWIRVFTSEGDKNTFERITDNQDVFKERVKNEWSTLNPEELRNYEFEFDAKATNNIKCSASDLETKYYEFGIGNKKIEFNETKTGKDGRCNIENAISLLGNSVEKTDIGVARLRVPSNEIRDFLEKLELAGLVEKSNFYKYLIKGIDENIEAFTSGIDVHVVKGDSKKTINLGKEKQNLVFRTVKEIGAGLVLNRDNKFITNKDLYAISDKEKIDKFVVKDEGTVIKNKKGFTQCVKDNLERPVMFLYPFESYIEDATQNAKSFGLGLGFVTHGRGCVVEHKSQLVRVNRTLGL